MNFRFFIKIAAILHFFGFRPQVTMQKTRHIWFRRKVMILKNLSLSLFCLETKKKTTKQKKNRCFRSFIWEIMKIFDSIVDYLSKWPPYWISSWNYESEKPSIEFRMSWNIEIDTKIATFRRLFEKLWRFLTKM